MADDYTRQFNSILGTTTSQLAASLSSSQASTSQSLEILADRRRQSSVKCPEGFIKAGTTCVPATSLQSAYATTSNQSSASKPAADAVKKPGAKRSAKPAPNLASDDADQSTSPDGSYQNLDFSRRGAWGEVFADYERRSNLSRTEFGSTTVVSRSHGVLTGYDEIVNLHDGSALQIGGLVGLTKSQNEIKKGSLLDFRTLRFEGCTAPGVDCRTTPNAFVNVSERTLAIPYDGPTVEDTSSGPTVGIYGSKHARNGYFFDFMGKVDFLEMALVRPSLNAAVDTRGCILPTGLPGVFPVQVGSDAREIANANGGRYYEFLAGTERLTYRDFVIAGNFGRRVEVDTNAWWEPFFGGRATYTQFDSDAGDFGLDDGYTVRLQAGIKYGFSRIYRRAVWTQQFGAMLYSDIAIGGYTQNVAAPLGARRCDFGGAERNCNFVNNSFGTDRPISAIDPEADEGRPRVELSYASQWNFGEGISTFIELQGRVGEDYIGGGGRAGARIEW